jgi:hypothetical protein
MKKVGKFSKRKKCCHFTRTCHGYKCKKHTQKCKWMGPTLSTVFYTRCKFIRFGSFKRKRRCCTFRRFCQNTTCTTSRYKCRWVGGTYHHGCTWRTVKKCVQPKRRRQRGFKVNAKLFSALVVGGAIPGCVTRCVGKCAKSPRCYNVCKRAKLGKRGFKACRSSCALKCLNTCSKISKCVRNFRKVNKVALKKNRVAIRRQLKKTKNGKKVVKRIQKRRIVKRKRTITQIRRIQKRRRLNKKRVVKRRRSSRKNRRGGKSRKSCSVGGNPLIKTFGKKSFNKKRSGDFILARTKSFRVDVRLKKWNKRTVATEFAVRLNKKDKIELTTEEFILLNGKSIILKPGQVAKAQNGGYIRRISQNKFRVVGRGKNSVVATFYHQKGNQQWPQPQFVNIKVSVRGRKLKGMCRGRKNTRRARGLFANEYNPEFPQ